MQYPQPKTTEPKRWAWEFLRRNPSYLADWKRYTCCRNAWARYFVLPAEARSPGVAWDEFGLDESIEECGFRLAEKYGISNMRDPGRADLLLLGWRTDRMTAYGVLKAEVYSWAIGYGLPEKWSGGELPSERRYNLRVSAEDTFIKFNLAQPIAAQLERANQLLKNLQADFKRRHPELMRSNKRNRGEYFRAYLQLLDAEEFGASVDEMATLLPKDLRKKGSDLKKAVKYSVDRAKWFRDVGYRYLLLMPHEEK